MGEVLARYADGRLLVREERAVESRYCGSGVPVRISPLNAIEKVLSVSTDYAMRGLVTDEMEAWIGYRVSGGVWSGQPQERADHLMVVMRRGDIPTANTSGYLMSGPLAQGLMSGITSGLNWMAELLSGHLPISGVVKVRANVIGY